MLQNEVIMQMFCKPRVTARHEDDNLNTYVSRKSTDKARSSRKTEIFSSKKTFKEMRSLQAVQFKTKTCKIFN